jgi:hypothetical protein
MPDPFAPYGRLYSALAPLCLVFSFGRPFAVGKGLNVDVESFGSVWDMAATPAGAPARVAVFLLLSMFGCLLAAAVWPRVPALPVINAIAATIIGALLVTRPRTGQPPPDLSGLGRGQLIVAAGIVIVSIVYIGHLVTDRRRARPGGRRDEPGPRGEGQVAMSVDTNPDPRPASRTPTMRRLGVVAAARSADGLGIAVGRYVDRVAGAAEASWCAYRRAVWLFDHRRPRGGQAAAMLHLAATRCDQATAKLREPLAVLLTAVVSYAAVSAGFVLLEPWWPWWSAPVTCGVLVGSFALLVAAMTWLLRRGERRQRRLVPATQPADGDLDPPGSLGRVGQEISHIYDHVSRAKAALGPALAALPNPDHDAPASARGRRHHDAAALLRDADDALATVADSLDRYQLDLSIGAAGTAQPAASASDHPDTGPPTHNIMRGAQPTDTGAER